MRDYYSGLLFYAERHKALNETDSNEDMKNPHGDSDLPDIREGLFY